jgi:hypothetical protein
MDSPVSSKDEIWFLRVCHHISNAFYDDSCRNHHSNDLSTLAKVKEGHNVDDCSATEHELNEECRKNMNVAADKRTVCFTTTCSKTDAVDTTYTIETGHKANND